MFNELKNCATKKGGVTADLARDRMGLARLLLGGLALVSGASALQVSLTSPVEKLSLRDRPRAPATTTPKSSSVRDLCVSSFENERDFVYDLFHACGLRIINGYYRDVSASREVLRSAGRAVIASYECDSALSDSLSQTFKAEAELKPAKRTGALSRALRRMSDCKF